MNLTNKAGRRRVDWAALHRRIEASRAGSAEAVLPSPAEQERILKERARVLSEPPQAGRHTADELEFVVFALGEEQYGIESLFLREVTMAAVITPLPTAPAWIAGLFNLRGQILPVIDLKRFFELPATAFDETRAVLLLDDGRMEFGIATDGVLGIARASRAGLQPRLATTGVREEYLKGITPGRVALLDGARLLEDPKLIVREEVQ